MIAAQLPPRVRLLHVGLMKTGTTSLQSAASSRRGLLLRHGVRYPGRRYNHRQAAFALRRRAPQSESSSSERHPDEWDALMSEISDDPERRVLISNELIADWPEPVARRFVEELGPLTHVVITVRRFAALLPSVWQQYVKSGHCFDLENFCALLLNGPSAAPNSPNLERHDQGLVVSRWAQIVGPENTTVVVVDKDEPARVSDSFEAMLGLPTGALRTHGQGGFAQNRSLTAAEAALLLQINQVLKPYAIAEDELIKVVRNGAIARVLDECSLPGPEEQLILPPWAMDRAALRGRAQAEIISRSGVRVVGDLTELGRASSHRAGQWILPETVPTQVAAEAVVGALSAGLDRGSNFGRRARSRPSPLARPTRRFLRRVRALPSAVLRTVRL
jgi:hypothetical protein